MKKSTKWILLIPISLALSVFITRTEISYNASPCLYNDVCQEKTLLTKRTVKHGYPVVYEQTTTSTPQDSSKSGMVDQGSGLSTGLIFVNAVFWLAILSVAFKLLEKQRNKK